jgi:hypothetical protein
MMIDMLFTLRCFAKLKNRRRDSSSDCSFSKALVPAQFTDTWSPYSGIRLTRRLESKSDMPASRRATFRAKMNLGLVIVLTFWGRFSPIFLGNFLLRLDRLLRHIPVSRDIQSKRSSSGGLAYGDSPEDCYDICSRRLKKATGQRWRITCPVSSIAKRIILFLEL